VSTPVTVQVIDSQASKLARAYSALEIIERYLARETLRVNLTQTERVQIISALAYARSQRRTGISDAAQQHRDWVEAEADLDLVLTHLCSLTLT